MNFDVEGRIEAAMAVMREQQKRMAEAKAELDRATASVTTKDRMATAVVGPQGQVVSITFHTNAFQSMAPAELASALTNLLNEARAKMGEQVIAKMKDFGNIAELVNAAAGVDELPAELDELMKPLRAMRPGFEAEEEKKRRPAKQEEFSG
ncbi:YbaB/EbfC family nucleoid-associated protein [Streptomyces sp. NPDC058548]|uniref:YbaB/EbfC family nucleoid-associated protein n=1 Tax=unclassified Streptomyces TaxID=2593676 RepID=UPI00365EB9BA